MPPSVTWIHAGDRYPHLKDERDHFLALDGEEIVGAVRLVDGRWTWAMVQVRPGTPFSGPRSGTTKSRREAVTELVAAWRDSLGAEDMS